MKKIPLIATAIEFTRHAIIYKVDCKIVGVPVCSNDIKTKDLILRPTLIDANNQEVIFTVLYCTPQYYLDIMNGTARNLDENYVDITNIYSVGDTVGYIIK